MTVALSDGRAQAYYCHTESLDPATVDRALHMLSREEQERHNHFFRDRDRRDYGAAHVLLRVVLAAHTNTTPEQVTFSTGSSGKPCLVSPREDTARLSFSLSHTPGLVACVIGAENALGIDVEAIDRSIRALEIARDVFSPDEAAALQDCSIEERPLRFFELWTLKEAFLKASGAGLAGMLHCASFAVQGHHVRVRHPACAAITVLEPTSTLCATCIKLSSLAPERMIVEPVVARSIVTLAPIST